MKKADFLRNKYPRFIYESFSYKPSNGNLEIFFNFLIVPDIQFRPKIVIKNIKRTQIKRVGKEVLKNLVFHLGLIEMLSYWKATCSPEIIIKTGYLNPEQIRWWKDLIIKGMSQFFYENKIDFREPNFLKIKTNQTKNPQNPYPYKKQAIACFLYRLKNAENGVLVPVGGGKDSVVTLEILSSFAPPPPRLRLASKTSEDKEKIHCFSLNPTEAAQKIMKIAGCKNPVIVKRGIDERLLELNQKGFLSGHTPFSAYLAFLSVLAGVIFDRKYIAFSNERSSNEGNLNYRGRIINHQWSKSFEFEKKFRGYSKKYLVKNIEYFSFLRPLYEIQIAKLFSRYPKYFPAFLSCNEAQKTDSGRKLPSKKWCGSCPKCLFIFTILYLFIGGEKLIKIFGKNLFEDESLLSTMKELIGKRGVKPFECVGTKKESLAAFYLDWEKHKDRVSERTPFLLRYFERKILPKYPNLKKDSQELLNSWNNHHNIPREFLKVLRKNV